MNNIYFIIIAITAIIYVINVVRKGRFSIEESIFWVFGSLIVLILSIFPKIIDKVALFIGIEYPPSLFFVLCILFLLFINFRHSRKIAIQEKKIIELAQSIALINEKVVIKK